MSLRNSARARTAVPVVTLLVLATVATHVAAVSADDIATMSEPRYAAGYATVNGVHYLVGGLTADRRVLDSISTIDPATGQVRLVGTLPNRVFQGAAAGAGGSVYFFGGADATATAQRDTYRFDPSTGDVQRVVGATFARGTIGATATTYRSSIVVAGGFDLPGDDNAWSDRIWRFDPVDGSLTAYQARLPTGRAYMAAATDGDHVWFVGGYGIDPAGTCGISVCTLDTILEFDPRQDSIRSVGTLPGPLRWATATHHDGTVYVIGGCDGNCDAWGASDAIVAIDTTSGSATTLLPRLPDRAGRAALFASAGGVHLVGGAFETAGNEQPIGSIVRVRLGVTPPWPPTGLSAQNTPDGVRLAWNASSYDGGAGPVTYSILRAPIGGPLAPIGTSDGAGFLDEDAPSGTTVEYAVRAVGGTGQASTPTPRVSILPRLVPAAPADVIAQGGDGKVVLQWLPPSGSNAGDVTDYRISCPDCPEGLRGLQVSGTRTSTLIQPLENGRTFTFNVRAVNDQGEGPATRDVTATPSQVPDPPQRLRVNAGNTTVELVWSPPTNDLEVTGYRVLRGPTLAELDPIATTDAQTTGHVDGTVPRGTSVLYAVVALRNDVSSPYSNVQRSGLPDLPGEPGAVWARAEGTGVLVGWTPPVDDGGSPVINYEVRRSGPDGTSLVGISRSAPLVDDGPPIGVNLTYSVAAVNSAGAGPTRTSDPVTVHGDDGRTPPTPVLSVQPPSGDTTTTFVLDASASSDDDGVVAYNFDFGDGTATGWTPIASATHRYAEPGEYAATVMVRDIHGTVSEDAAVKFVGVGRAPPDPEPPTNGGDGGGNGIPNPALLAPIAALVAAVMAARWGRPPGWER